MKPLQKVVIIVLVAMVLMFISNSYVVNTIKDRAIIVGMGIDYRDGEYEVTGEVICAKQTSPESGGTSQFSQLVTGKGKTISLAIYDIFVKTGKLPSISQCGVMVLGEELYKSENLENFFSHFILSDAFPDGSLVACCKGDAKELFGKMTPLDQSVSFGLQGIISGSGNNTGIPFNYMSKFVNSQVTSSASGFLTLLTFEKDEDVSAEENKKDMGFFSACHAVIFNNFYYVAELGKEEIRGLTLLTEPSAFETFAVEAAVTPQVFSHKVGIGTKMKKVEKELNFDESDKITYDIKIFMDCERLRTDLTGEVKNLLEKKYSSLDPSMKTQVEEQIRAYVKSAIDKSIETNCDFLGISNQFYKKYGKKWIAYKQEHPNILSKIKFSIKAEVDRNEEFET